MDNDQVNDNIDEEISIKGPKKLSTSLSINGANYIGDYIFLCGNEVPVYEIQTVHALNQIIGYAKFNNQNYGKVYYRGECKLHKSLQPSLYRNVKKTEKANAKISNLINKIIADEHMKNNLKLGQNNAFVDRIKVEGMLQHYGIPTRFIDIVDNHWIALWMGLNNTIKPKQFNEYRHYEPRNIPLVEIASGESLSDDSLFQYILLMAVPYEEYQNLDGVQISADYIEVDLRQALPSTFLRPHAQHGLVVRRKVHDQNGVEGYDLAPTIIGVLKIRIDIAKQWLGEGALLTQENLFPPPAYDYGYDILLFRKDLFEDSEHSIIKYV